MKESFRKILCVLLLAVMFMGVLSINILIADGAESDWSGASAVFVGDSITYGSRTEKVYHTYIDEFGVFDSVHSMGVSGSCISSQSDYGYGCSPLADRYSSIPDANLIVIFMGTNDYSHETPLGCPSDMTDVSFYGALNVIISGIKALHNDSQLVFVTPLHRFGFGTSKILGTQFTYDYIANGRGHTLADYVNAIKDVCKKHRVPVIDLYNQYPIDPTNEAERIAYMPDGLHPDSNGHKIIADLIVLNLKMIAEKDNALIPCDHRHSYTVTRFASNCKTKGYEVYICNCGDSYYSGKESVAEHRYDGDSCSVCGESKIDNCSCNCHKSGIKGIIWKILRFFYKLFRINPVCACGVNHY